MKETILAISGRSGLYRLVSKGRGNLIVESINENKRRMPVGGRERVTSLGEISIYTTGEDMPLLQVFDKIKKMNNGEVSQLDHKKSSDSDIVSFMKEVLPEYDTERVHLSDIRKLIQWYNILIENGINDFVEPEDVNSVPDDSVKIVEK